MERITSPGRILIILIAEGFSDRYPQLFKPSSQIKQDRDLMQLVSQQDWPQTTGTYGDVFINNAVTFNLLFNEGQGENIFYPNSYIFRAVKRAFDILFSLAVIVFILSWFLPIIYLLIKLESEGPVFFIQERSCRDNNSFSCYKFRTMYINEECNISQTSEGDVRITRVGSFLRRSSLDELPQFFNVLLGDMSVVGPRPHMLSQTRHYSVLIDTFMVRHFIKPGITGWAQINGLRGQTKTVKEMLDRVEADVWYIKNWSFLLDLKIVIITSIKMLTGDKNAF